MYRQSDIGAKNIKITSPQMGMFESYYAIVHIVFEELNWLKTAAPQG